MKKEYIVSQKENDFIKAVKSGDMESVTRFVNEKNININAISPEFGNGDLSAIYIALDNGHDHIVNFLLDIGACIDVNNMSENHLLHRINNKTSFDIAKKIINKETPESLSNIQNAFGISVIQSMLWYFTPLNIVQFVYDKVKPFKKHLRFSSYLTNLEVNSPHYDIYFNQALSFCRENKISLQGDDFLFSCFMKNNKDVIKRIKEYYPEELEPLVQEFKKSISEKNRNLSKYISISDLFSIYPLKEDWFDKNVNIYNHAIKNNQPHILAYMLNNGLSPNEQPLLKLLLEGSKNTNFKNANKIPGVEYGFNELIAHKDLKISRPMELLIQIYISSDDGDENVKLALKQRVALLEKERLESTIITSKNKLTNRI